MSHHPTSKFVVKVWPRTCWSRAGLLYPHTVFWMRFHVSVFLGSAASAKHRVSSEAKQGVLIVDRVKCEEVIAHLPHPTWLDVRKSRISRQDVKWFLPVEFRRTETSHPTQ